jgi:hypothetical protein
MIRPVDRRDTWLAVGIGLGSAAVFTLLGAWLHQAAGLGGEMDDYDGRALRMANGIEAGDPYHPYGMPLAMLAGIRCGLDALAAGRLVAALGGGALLAATYLLCRAWTNRTAAVLTTLAAAASEIVVVNAQLAASDMPAAGLLALALLGWQRTAASSTTAVGRCLLAGVAFGAALACRQSSLFVFAGMLPVLIAVPWRVAAVRTTATAVGAAIGWLPHLVAQRAYGAGPPHPGNAANLVLKYRFDFDYERIGRMDAAAIADDLRQHWPEYLQRGLVDVADLFAHQLARCLALLPTTWMAIAVSLAGTSALLLGLLRGPRDCRVLALAGLGYGALLALTFTPIDRLLLPLLPALLPLALAAAARGGQRVTLATAMSLAGVAVAALSPAVQRFLAMQVDVHLLRMRELVAQERRPLVFVCDFGRMGDVPGGMVVSTPASWRGLDPAGQREWLRELVARHHADYVVCSRCRSHELLANVRAGELPDGWQLVRDDETFVLRMPPPDLGAWQTAVVHDDAGWAVKFRVPALAPGAKVTLVGCAVRDAAGATQLSPAAEQADGSWLLRLPDSSALRGEFQFTPMVAAEPGGILRGATVTHTFGD